MAESNTYQYSLQGLRTLVIAERQLDYQFYSNWKLQYKQALATLENREQVVESTISVLESDMNFVGVTALEDLLQDNVKSSIESLRQAGLRVWMLTGDKLETAKSISITTGLFNQNEKLYVIKDIDDATLMTNEIKNVIAEIRSNAINKEFEKATVSYTS